MVIRLATNALIKQGKDLQVAAWLAEAVTHQAGYLGLKQGLELIGKLLEQYWDTVYPPVDEDGDLELRATPLMWVGSQLDRVVRAIPLTENGFNWFDYHSARSIPSEEEASRDETKRAIRQDAIDRQRPTTESFEAACQDTPVAFYERRQQDIAAVVAQLESLTALADERFGDASPGFGRLRDLLDEMAQTARVLLVKRRQSTVPQAAAPQPPPMAPPLPLQPVSVAVDDWGDPISAPEPQAAIQLDSWEQPSWPEPAPYSPVPYLLSRAAGWGELYEGGVTAESVALEAPSVETRVELKKLWQAGDWEQLLQATERAMALPCGRAWLDLQRYAVRAAENTGRESVARAIRSNLRALLEDYPSLHEWTLNDDTPAASPETKEWLRTTIGQARPVPGTIPSLQTDAEDDQPDPFDEAVEVARTGRAEQAFAILAREASQETSGRGRFLRRTQLAHICLMTRNEGIAVPILEELTEEIDRRHIEDWEAQEFISEPLAMLVRCMDRTGDDPERRQKLYARICRLDPARALSLAR